MLIPEKAEEAEKAEIEQAPREKQIEMNTVSNIIKAFMGAPVVAGTLGCNKCVEDTEGFDRIASNVEGILSGFPPMSANDCSQLNVRLAELEDTNDEICDKETQSSYVFNFGTVQETYGYLIGVAQSYSCQ